MKVTPNISCGPDTNDKLYYKGMHVGYITSVDLNYWTGEWRSTVTFRLEEKSAHLAFPILQEFQQSQVAAIYETGTDWDPQVYFKSGEWVIEMIPT